MKKFIALCSIIFAGTCLYAADTEEIVAKIKAGDRRVLAGLNKTEIDQVQSHKGVFFYIPRVIGQKAVRSLFGCFENKSAGVRKVCADSLYQLKLNYVHKKYVIFLLKKEKEAPVKMSLQDIVVRMNEERFSEARKARDTAFLLKVTPEELAVVTEKGVPASKAFGAEDIPFLVGGLMNSSGDVRIFAVKMLGRVPAQQERIRGELTRLRKREKLAAVKKEIDISLGCLNGNTSCPDIYMQDGN